MQTITVNVGKFIYCAVAIRIFATGFDDVGNTVIVGICVQIVGCTIIVSIQTWH